MAGVSESIPDLFSPFFANAVVLLGRLRSPTPVALYYNPLLDLAFFTLWEEQAEGYGVVTARALPGERLADPRAEVALLPAWMTAVKGPVAALTDITAARLESFRRAHPGPAADGAPDAVTFAAAASDLRAALPRLMWNAVQQARWTDSESSWLIPTLARTEAALASGDSAVLAAAAPETDEATAGVLAGLPAGFAAAISLDMVLDAGGGSRLLVGSLPEDGDIYVFVLCQAEDNVCDLRRFLLISLIGVD